MHAYYSSRVPPLMRQAYYTVLLLRVWLVAAALMLLVNGRVALPFLLVGDLRVVAFVSVSVLAIVWAVFAYNPTVVIVCAPMMGVSMILRAVEVLFYAERYAQPTRVTGFTLWAMMGVTTLVFGAINILVAGRRQVEERLYEHDHRRS